MDADPPESGEHRWKLLFRCFPQRHELTDTHVWDGLSPLIIAFLRFVFCLSDIHRFYASGVTFERILKRILKSHIPIKF